MAHVRRMSPQLRYSARLVETPRGPVVYLSMPGRAAGPVSDLAEVEFWARRDPFFEPIAQELAAALAAQPERRTDAPRATVAEVLDMTREFAKDRRDR